MTISEKINMMRDKISNLTLDGEMGVLAKLSELEIIDNLKDHVKDEDSPKMFDINIRDIDDQIFNLLFDLVDRLVKDHPTALKVAEYTEEFVEKVDNVIDLTKQTFLSDAKKHIEHVYMGMDHPRVGVIRSTFFRHKRRVKSIVSIIGDRIGGSLGILR